MKKIGIFGGTFSPVHNGHVSAALAFRDAIGLDELIIMPSRIPPHKQIDQSDNPANRLYMARLAFESLHGITVSDWEACRNEVSYTVNTLEHFKDDGNLYFLCGTDMFLTMNKWYRPERIFELSTIVLARREKNMTEEIEQARRLYENFYKAKIIFLDNEVIDLSSTDIRTQLKNGGNITELVPEKVAEYIQNNKLYRI